MGMQQSLQCLLTSLPASPSWLGIITRKATMPDRYTKTLDRCHQAPTHTARRVTTPHLSVRPTAVGVPPDAPDSPHTCSYPPTRFTSPHRPTPPSMRATLHSGNSGVTREPLIVGDSVWDDRRWTTEVGGCCVRWRASPATGSQS